MQLPPAPASSALEGTGLRCCCWERGQKVQRSHVASQKPPSSIQAPQHLPNRFWSSQLYSPGGCLSVQVSLQLLGACADAHVVTAASQRAHARLSRRRRGPSEGPDPAQRRASSERWPTDTASCSHNLDECVSLYILVAMQSCSRRVYTCRVTRAACWYSAPGCPMLAYGLSPVAKATCGSIFKDERSGRDFRTSGGPVHRACAAVSGPLDFSLARTWCSA